MQKPWIFLICAFYLTSNTCTGQNETNSNFYSCQNQNTTPYFRPKLVFSEVDTFTTSLGNTQINKTDYYLISQFSIDKILMKSLLDSFVNWHPEFRSTKFGNYDVVFYLENADLSQKIIEQEQPRFRYKLFTYLKDTNYILDYNFRGSSYSQIDWNGKYYKLE